MAADKKINFIGSLPPPVGGETVKNSILIEALEKRDVELNTINILKSKFILSRYLLSLFFKKDENLIMSLSSKARLFFIPYAFFLIKINGYDVALLPIGGRLYDEIEGMPFFLRKVFVKFLSEFDQIYVESKYLKEQLNNMLDREIVSYLPNFKERPDNVSNDPYEEGDKLELVYLGRMAEDKGIFDMVDAFDILRDKNRDMELHFYGTFPKEDSVKMRFQKKIEGKERIIHHGYLSDEELIETLSDHHLFVFPTYHAGECFPGVLLDAFFSGLPVVASDWRFNGEIIENEKNGLLCEPKDPKDIAKKIDKLYKNEKLLRDMSRNAFVMSERYDVDTVVDGLLDDLEEYGWFD